MPIHFQVKKLAAGFSECFRNMTQLGNFTLNLVAPGAAAEVVLQNPQNRESYINAAFHSR